MFEVLLQGTGHLNGSVVIDKKLELEDAIGKKLLNGSTKKETLAGIMSTHYPGVKYEPNNIRMRITPLKNKKKSKGKSSNTVLKAAALGAIASSALSGDKETKKEVKEEVEVDLTKNIKEYTQIDFNDDPTSIMKDLDTLFIVLSSETWPTRPVNDMNKKDKEIVLKQILGRYKLGYRKLKKLKVNPEELDVYKKQKKTLLRKKILKQNALTLSLVLLFLFLLIMIAIVG